MKRPPRYPGRMLAKIPDEKRRREVERSYERIANRFLYQRLSEDKKMSETKYIERYWRDAKPEDAIKQPPMVARLRDDSGRPWRYGKLTGCDRSPNFPEESWFIEKACGAFCQVYDAPDPGEGWRLIDPDKDDYRQDGIDFWYPGEKRWCSRSSVGRDQQRFTIDDLVYYRIRITPAVKYVPFTWDDREELRGRWIFRKSQPENEFSIATISKGSNGKPYAHGIGAETLCSDYAFCDTGEPVGKKVTQ